MKGKKVISVFLMLVMTTQVIPLKQIASWLFSSQLAEELVHAKGGAKSNTGLDEIHKHFTAAGEVFTFKSLIIGSGAVQQDAEMLIARHSDDIPTPPPNC